VPKRKAEGKGNDETGSDSGSIKLPASRARHGSILFGSWSLRQTLGVSLSL